MKAINSIITNTESWVWYSEFVYYRFSSEILLPLVKVSETWDDLVKMKCRYFTISPESKCSLLTDSASFFARISEESGGIILLYFDIFDVYKWASWTLNIGEDGNK